MMRARHGAGETVPCVVDADVPSVVELLAVWRIGATPAPLSRSLTEPERAAAAQALAGAQPGGQVILWTSGTEGRPRGVVIPFAALEANAAASQERLGLSAADVWLASLSPAHVGGLALIVRALLLGSRLLLPGRIDIDRTADLLRGNGFPPKVAAPTHLSLVPTQLARLLPRFSGPPAALRCVLLGGAEAPRELLAQALARAWPVALTYGLTEATSQVATSTPQATREKPGSVGRPLRGVEVRIAPDGEILVRGATLASGYVGVGAGRLVDPEGWLHTGDLGRLDDDGDLWVVGRRADRIVSGGFTVDAVEVEEVLRSHPQVADACVVGIPDATWGERVAAWIEPAGSVLDLDALDTYLRSRLAAPKLPRRYHVQAGIPRNVNGKVERGTVRETLRQGTLLETE
jgi:O-succinylbenzoic acid--CoA ligase